MNYEKQLPLHFVPNLFLGSLTHDETNVPISKGVWYTAQNVGDGLVYYFQVSMLAMANYITADILLDGNRLVTFMLTLQEGEQGRTFGLIYGLLNQCSARIRLPLEAVHQSRWCYEREGAWLKPICTAERVDLTKVDRLKLTVYRKDDCPIRFCLTPITVSVKEPPLLTQPVLPKGPLLDEMGQNALYSWPTKTARTDLVTTRLHAQLASSPEQHLPASYSRWGGWIGKHIEATGFFRAHHDGQRWWLIDPDGYLFWSVGLNCVQVDEASAGYSGLDTALTWKPDITSSYKAIYKQPENGTPTINYLAANFIRAFGPEVWYDCWAKITLSFLRKTGFNTIANWSDVQIAQRARFPYVIPLSLKFLHTPLIYRDFPDVFHPNFSKDAAVLANQLCATVTDPALIGYFLMNEPVWSRTQEPPAAGMLFTTQTCASRVALCDFLRSRYGDDASLSTSWGMETTLGAIAEGQWSNTFTQAAKDDLFSFSEIMVERLFKELSKACKAVDPNHLNLGVRYYTFPPAWAIQGMSSFDVFSMNCYTRKVPAEKLAQISTLLNCPTMIGEWHFGSLDVGLPASGIGRVCDQIARGQAFRVYTEHALLQPSCIGIHYFALYDQSALGRYDGENYNIGFLDVCNRPYEPLASAARASHARLYQVAWGEIAPFDHEPEYLSKLFI